MRYEELINLEVLDHQTGLIWMKQTAEQTFDEAQEYAERAAKATGLAWRLPTKDELIGLVDGSRQGPASGFPNMPSKPFWSSSPYVGNTNYAWFVGFDDGYVGYGSRLSLGAVRLVRGGL
jgi:hypothetical protein